MRRDNIEAAILAGSAAVLMIWGVPLMAAHLWGIL